MLEDWPEPVAGPGEAIVEVVTNARRDQLADTVSLVAEGRINPRVAARFPLAEASKAHALVEAGGVAGRVVLLPGA